MDTLQLNEKRWANYETEKALTHLCAIGSMLHEGILQHVLFPINIYNIHWAAIEVNVIDQTLIFLGGVNPVMTLTSFIIGWAIMASLDLHAIFCNPLFNDNRAFSLCMEEFLDLAYDHLELLVPDDGMDICNGSDVDDASDFEPEETSSGAESEHDLEVEETQPSISTQSSSMQTNKPKLDLRTTDTDKNKGLFKFFPKVSCKEHLQCAWKPFAWELRDQERDHYQQEFNKFEKATCKHERAAE
ncbi:uncharacterized protein F5891DRAFT_1188851 [Suillus fuscotomentosus]|uniref:Uncharacterized protein n=1 Tax=Suillus fuscotomentosus TaxID=1912939 RepID=A0AAD4E5K9_9AGAM|nr:uncharacterized protein F5891DRAFT_1188851 [Suillus fuscotomentosus]KAG1900158.1 hypothetical protein F5891DRAFT_1188851 [Suillus fuscotomentosus]